MSHLEKEGSAPPFDPSAECLEYSDDLCSPYYSQTPEVGIGVLQPMFKAEAAFNWLASKLTIVSSILLILITVFITIDVGGRLFFNKPWNGITDLEMLFMSVVGFAGLAIPVVQRQNLQIDLFYELFSSKTKRCLYLFANLTGTWVGLLLGYRACLASLRWTRDTGILEIAEWPVVLITGICLILAGIAFFFQVLHIVRAMWSRKELGGILIAVAMAALLVSLPFI